MHIRNTLAPHEQRIRNTSATHSQHNSNTLRGVIFLQKVFCIHPYIHIFSLSFSLSRSFSLFLFLSLSRSLSVYMDVCTHTQTHMQETAEAEAGLTHARGQLLEWGADVTNDEKGVTYQELMERAECWLVEASNEVS